MADITIERRSGMPAWVWLLAVAAIIGLIWWLVAAGDRDRVMGANQTVVPGPMTGAAVPASTTLTSLDDLYTVTAPNDFVGRSVEITEPVRVLSVTGDKTFWVGQNTGRQVLVVLDQQPTPNQPATEGRYDVNPGQTVRVWGDVRRFPGYDEASRMWNVNPAVRSELENQKIYIHANRLEIVSRP